MELDTQNHTESPENELTTGITMPQAHAVILKTGGHTYGEISEQLGVSVNTIKDWFRRGNAVYGAYKRYSSEIIYQLSTDSMLKLRLQSERAVDTILELMDKKYPPAIRLSASKFIVERDSAFTEKERVERADFFGRIQKVFEIMDIKPENLSEKSEYGDKCRESFNKYMDYLDNMESWT